MDRTIKRRGLRRFLNWSISMLAAAVLAVALITWVVSWALTPVPIGPAAAPEPAKHPDAVIQVYGADAWGWRGRYGIHTWVATKPANASEYTIYEVIGWRLRRGRSAVRIQDGDPARYWYGSAPLLLHESRGPDAEALIDDIELAVERYPFANEYRVWPGPNSNSFVAWIGLAVPELGLELPAKAVGKGWMYRNFDDYAHLLEPPQSVGAASPPR